MRIITLLLALSLSGLAGCISGEKLDEGTTDSAVAPPADLAVQMESLLADENASAAVDAPVWSVGNAWTVQSFGGVDETCVIAVTSAGDSYTIAPSCETMAIYDVVFDVSWLGPIRADDLAGAQHGTPVRFFDFPLENGKTWTTTWDGLDVTLTATLVPNLAAPGLGGSPGYAIVGTTADGAEYVKYDYSPLLKWWTGIEFVQEGYGIRVQKFDEAYKGALLGATANRVLDHSPTVPGVFTPAGTFTVSESQDALVVLLAGGAPGYGVVANVIDPAGSIAYQFHSAAPEGGFFDFAVLPATPGQYEVSTVGTYNPQGGWFQMTFDEVAFEEIVLM